MSEEKVPDITKLFNTLVNEEGSDLHLRVKRQPRIRVDGKLHSVDTKILTERDTTEMLKGVMPENKRQELDETGQTDFALSIKGKRFRANVFRENNGLAAVFRLLGNQIPTLEELGLSKAIQKLGGLDRGLILVTGATGSGKTTTLASMISYINKHHSKHILTIEDPIEYTHEDQKSLVTQREITTHVRDFPQAIKAAMREDPDVILIGEMRDPESIRAALSAAETGHLVLATLHSSSAAGTITRIIDSFHESEQANIRTMLAGSIAGIISQQLLPRKDGKGRVAAREILLGTPAARAQIRENKLQQIPSIIQTNGSLGMQTMENAIEKLVKAGIIHDPKEEIQFEKLEPQEP